jgi:transposase
MTGNNPTDRSKRGTKRHILGDTRGLPLPVVISSASTHNIKLVTDVMGNTIIKRASSSTKPSLPGKRKPQHLCLDKSYNSTTVKREIISWGYVPYLPYKGKRGEIRTETQKKSNRKKHPARRWAVERTNSWHNRFRKLQIRYEKKGFCSL